MGAGPRCSERERGCVRVTLDKHADELPSSLDPETMDAIIEDARRLLGPSSLKGHHGTVRHRPKRVRWMLSQRSGVTKEMARTAVSEANDDVAPRDGDGGVAR